MFEIIFIIAVVFVWITGFRKSKKVDKKNSAYERYNELKRLSGTSGTYLDPESPLFLGKETSPYYEQFYGHDSKKP